VSVTATQEFNLRNQLDEIKAVWAVTDFKVVKHKDRMDSYKLSEMDVVQSVLDESLTNISNIMGSRYVKRLQSEAESWQQKLNVVADTIEAWKEF
jgi:dynein heavy chain, axonemal